MSLRGRRLGRGMRHALPWLVFVASAVGGLYLYIDIGQRSPIIGFVQSTEHRVSATHTGRIQHIAVELGQHVHAGQVVVELDPAQIDAEIALQQAELERIYATGTREQLGALVALGRLAGASEGTAADLARAEAELRAKTAEWKALTNKRHELAALLARGAVVKRDLIRLEVRQASLEASIRAARSAVHVLRKQLVAAQARQQALPNGLPDGRLSSALAKVQRRRLERLALERANLTLRAPCDGRVSLVHEHEGAVVREGQPIATIVADDATRVLACVYENMAAAPRIGMRVTLATRVGDNKQLSGTVVALAPVVTELPQRCRPVPSQPAWGRSMVVRLDRAASPVLAGEAFNIQLAAPYRWGGQALAAPPETPRRPPSAARPPPPSAAAAIPEATAPSLLSLPAELRAASRFEPSGLVWVPRLDRYLLVSDDTGFPQHNDHAPWIFSMDRQGHVDAEPVVLRGVDQVNDLESITAGPDGVIYVLSSQSYSKKGKRKRSRQALLRLVPQGRNYRVRGSVALASLLEDAGADLLGTLGLHGLDQLDIEGMTAATVGAGKGLLIGLKAPLDSQGRALIWRMATPERLFASGKLADADLSLWGRVALKVEADGQRVPGGIAELLQLADRSLVVASTAPNLRVHRQSGTLWHVTAPQPAGGVLQAHLLHTFPGLKPEGLALAPQHDKLVVVFDTGPETPPWLQLPYPH